MNEANKIVKKGRKKYEQDPFTIGKVSSEREFLKRTIFKK